MSIWGFITRRIRPNDPPQPWTVNVADTAGLFAPLRIRTKELRNRIVMAPMISRRGITTDAGINWYEMHAKGGCGLVIVEATSANLLGTAFNARNLAPLVEAIHSAGALAAIQLFFPESGKAPKNISKKRIEEIIAEFGIAAKVAAEAGFDGVEPHGAFGYLLNQFFSPVQNRRKDEYGGCLDNRMRMALRLVEEIRANINPEMLLLYRHTPVGKGYDVAESVIFAERLISAGVDILDPVPSSVDSPGDRAAPFKRLKAAVMASNGLDNIANAVEVLNSNKADLVAIGRGLIADPELPNKVKEGRFDEIVQCRRCNEKCHGHRKKGIPIACAQWK